MLNKNAVIFFLALFFPALCFAGQLDQDQVTRVKSAKYRLGAVDTKTLDETVATLQDSSYPEGNLQILEAVSRTFAEIVQEQEVQDNSKKEWLYSMILLNMAYFQLSGGVDDGNKNTLNVLIRKKLKKHLPSELFENRQLFHSIE